MTRILVQSTDEGIRVSPEALEAAGASPGTLFGLEPLPAPREIQRTALAYVCWKLGDAIRVGQPNWDGEAWLVPLISPDELHQIGELALDANGEVILDRAPTPEALLENHDAARASAAAA